VRLVLGIGPAGTGKTLLACQQAIHDLKDGVVDKIIITRPVIPVEEEEIGYLPGNINKKMAPWTQPIFDIFMDHYTKKEIDMMIQFNIIEIAPLAFMRGRTFQRAFIIADEMQNSTPKQMLMLTSRLGGSSKMVITGDFEQSDKDKYNNGLADFLARFRLFKRFRNKKKRIMEAVRDTLMLPKNASSIDNDAFCEVRVILFNPNDIQRSPFVKKIIEMYNMENDDEKGVMKRVRKNVTEPIIVPEPQKAPAQEPQTKQASKPIITQLSSSEPSKMDAAIIPANHISKHYNAS
jgi:phosphate starvation-inducible PhoH-like protein